MMIHDHQLRELVAEEILKQIQPFIGKKYVPNKDGLAVNEVCENEIRKKSPSISKVRTCPEGGMLTMDFIATRLTIFLDGNQTIKGFRMG